MAADSGALSAPEEAWTTVGGKRAARSRRHHDAAAAARRPTPPHDVRETPCWETSTAAAAPAAPLHVSSLERVVELVAAAPWYHRLRENLLAGPAFTRMLVLGLGPVSSSPTARAQLALAALLARDVVWARGDGDGDGDGDAGRCLSWDPAFDAEDVALQRHVGLRVAPSGSDAERAYAARAGERVLWYMPHCEAELYEAVLAANGSGTGAGALLGNSFAAYVERWATAGVAPRGVRPRRLLALAPAVAEVALDAAAFPVPAAFNDTSLHTWDAQAAAARWAADDVG